MESDKSRELRFGKRMLSTVVVAVIALFAMSAVSVAADKPKRTIKGNMTEVYHKLPDNASNLMEIFTKGMYYGRLRTTIFKWNWEDHGKHDPRGFAVGGSLIYKTAPFYGVSATVGYYYSHTLDALKDRDAWFGKSGKDTFSRYDALNDNKWYMSVFAQAYLEYKFGKTDIKAGRMIVECPFVKSNDTKMIPNTMQGFTVKTKEIPKTTLNLMYFDKQKLRDHTKFHDVITFGNNQYNQPNAEPWDKWANQDDSAVHKGLSYTNLEAAGMHTNNRLIVLGLTNKSIPKLKLDVWGAIVPDLFATLLTEANYKISLGNGWTLTPGFRFMQQFDDGAGEIGGAALTGKLAGMSGEAKGYDDADSCDAKMYAGSEVLKKGPGKLHFGYSQVTDDADFITPWRAWPTQGYTRSMAQYNWEADTKSWMIKGVYDFGKAGLIKGFKASLDYTTMYYNDEKERLGSIKKTDRNIIHLDMWYKFPHLKKKYRWFEGLEAKARMGLVDADDLSNGSDPSYNEFRFELNYLF